MTIEPEPDCIITIRCQRVPAHFASSESQIDPVEPIMPLDLVRRLYGCDCAQNLQRWFADAGL
jgi:hypothetical protein